MAVLINIAEIASPGWDFVRRYSSRPAQSWSFFAAGWETSKLERFLYHPEVLKMGAALRGVASQPTKSDAVLISHMPRTTLYTEIFRRLLRPEFRHIAFSFNFTDLPTSWDFQAMRRVLSGLDAIVVFSKYEVELYSEYFTLPKEKFVFIPWCMDTPTIDKEFAAEPYVCAVGGEGRDFDVIFAAAQQLPNLNFRIVTRPGRVGHRVLPSNVEIMYDLKRELFWATVAYSQISVISLIDRTKCNGQITAVGSMRLGVPVVSSFSYGLTDYIQDGTTGLFFPPGDADALVRCIATLTENEELRRRVSEEGRAFAYTHCSERDWATLIDSLVSRL